MHRCTIYRFKRFLPYQWLTVMAMMFLLCTVSHFSKAQDLRKVAEPVVDSLKQAKDFAYANDESYLKKKEVEEDEGGSAWDGFYGFFANKGVRIIAYTLLIALLIFIIYRIIIVNNLFLFYSSKKIRTYDDEEEAVIIRDENIDDRINRAAREKDYRTAVRYLYLKGLRLLNDKGWIRYHAQSTNHDYVFQLSQYPVAPDFRFLTQVYDYVWYGEFAVNDEQFTRLQTDFKRFYQAVR